jgi:cyclic beta-1,2-glucan synthetase
VAGIRENGGQYTHAACWAVQAFAEQGEGNLAARLMEMLLPISHARTQAAADWYKTEPYVMAADIYGAPPHVGRGGWTWYTGSSGWAYRVAVESILGLRIESANTLIVAPCIPDDWPGYRAVLQHGPSGSVVEVIVENPHRSARRIVRAELSGRAVPVNGREAVMPLDSQLPRQQVRVELA